MPEQVQFCESTVADLSKSVARQQAAVGAVLLCVVDRLSPSMYALAEVGLKALLPVVDDMFKNVTLLAIPISNGSPHASDVPLNHRTSLHLCSTRHL